MIKHHRSVCSGESSTHMSRPDVCQNDLFTLCPLSTSLKEMVSAQPGKSLEPDTHNISPSGAGCASPGVSLSVTGGGHLQVSR